MAERRLVELVPSLVEVRLGSCISGVGVERIASLFPAVERGTPLAVILLALFPRNLSASGRLRAKSAERSTRAELSTSAQLSSCCAHQRDEKKEK